LLILVEALAVAIVATALSRPRRPRPATIKAKIPWNLNEVAGRQLIVVSGSAGITMTAIVLLITLGTNRGSSAGDRLESAVILFLVAWLSLAYAAVMYSRVPREEYAGPAYQRMHYVLANDAYLRAVLLVPLAMIPLLGVFELHEATAFFALIVGLIVPGGAAIALVVITQLGLIPARDGVSILVLSALGAGAAALAAAGTGIHATDATLPLALAVMALNFSEFWMTVVGAAWMGDQGRVLRFGMALVRWDFAASVTLLAFYWLWLTGAV
jgi:hypothetical protein